MTPFRRLLFVMVMASWALPLQGTANAATRAAVVLTNEMFAGRVLPTARADGELIAKTLQEAGFNVLLVQNLKTADMFSTSQSVEQHVMGSDVALLYIVGAGAAASGDILFQSVDAGPDAKGGVSLGSLIGIARKSSRSAIIVLDGVPTASIVAAGSPVRPLQRQLAPEAGASVLLSFSGAVNAPGVNDTAGANSIFATVFANAIAQSGVSVEQVFREVRRNVREATRGAQLPVAEGSVPPDLVLKQEAPDPITSQPRPTLDQIFWTLIKGSSDEKDYRLFETLFPVSPLIERAAARRISLASATVTDVGRLTRSVTLIAAAEGLQPRSVVQSLALGISGDRAPPVQIRSWPTALPKTAGGLGTMATSCDEVAGDPDDPQRLSPGIQWGLVNLRVAVRACFADLSKNPQDRRLLFQVGRLLDMLKLYVWAESFYRESARLGYAAAYANLAYLHMTGRGRPADMAAAIPYLKLGADLGNPRCRTDLGFNYLKGFGVERSPQEALLWLRLAAASGWPNALDILADMYLNGDGVEKDEVASVELLQASAWVGNTNAMSSIGRRFLEGRGVERNPATARIWFERSIKAGNAFAPLYLGIMYRDGDGVPKNPAKAVENMQLSADRGFGEARLRLGEAYETGAGVPKDLETAAFNYTLTDRQSFEHPVGPEFIAQAKDRLKQITPRLTQAQVKSVQRRVEEFIRLNGS